MTPSSGRARVLVIGGGGGLVGRAVVRELFRDHLLRSFHRTRATSEVGLEIEWVPGDVAGPVAWDRLLEDVDVVLNLVWYRWGSERRFRLLCQGLTSLLRACVVAEVPRFLHISVPPAPPSLEVRLPYLSYKRAFDADLARSGLSYAILRPTLLFGAGDRLLTVMMRLADRYPVFPMFGDGEYRLNPLSSSDLARAVRQFAHSTRSGTFDLGGPVSYRFRDLTDLMFRLLTKRARYWSISHRGSVRLARLLQTVGSSLLYAYEVEWLMSGLLEIPPYSGLDLPLERVEPFLAREADRIRTRRMSSVPNADAGAFNP